jgi:hypothetical protein
MNREKNNALVQRTGTEISSTGRRISPVIARMTREVLAQTKAHSLSQARFRIGEYLLRKPDFRQIQLLANDLDMAPWEVLEHLVSSRLEPERWENVEALGFAVEDGAIRSMVWDFDRLPIIPKVWQEGIQIRDLGLAGEWPEHDFELQPRISTLKTLYCCAWLY